MRNLMIRMMFVWIAIMVIAGLLLILLTILNQPPQPATLWGAMIVLSLLLVCVSLFAAQPSMRRGREAMLLSQLEQAVRQNLPLPQVVRALADEQRGAISNATRAAADVLEQGAPLAVALGFMPFAPRVIASVAAAEQVGRLPQALARLAEQYRRSRNNARRAVSFCIYPAMLIFVFIVLTTLLMVIVVPKFETIFHDFRIPLPPITVSLLRFANHGAPFALFGMTLALIALIPSTFWSTWRTWETESPWEWLADRAPWIGMIRLHQGLGSLLEFTAEAIDSGRSVNESLREARQMATSSSLRSLTGDWIERIESGQTLSEAARAAGMPELVGGMLATSAYAPDVASVFRFLGRYYRNRFSRAMLLLRAATVPAVAIGMGCMVGWVALSLIIPMIRLIDQCAAGYKGF